MSRRPGISIAKPDEVEVTLTITLPVHAWRHVRDGGRWNPFADAVTDMLHKIDQLRVVESGAGYDVEAS